MTDIEKHRAESRRFLSESRKISQLRGQTILIKYGGAAMEDTTLRAKTSADIALLIEFGIRPVVVHGGGKEISRWMTRLGIEPRFVEGLRYTDKEGIEITEMVLTGKINSELVSLLTRFGAPAIGLSGKDAGLFVSKRIRSESGEDLGFVGEIISTNTKLLKDLLATDLTPVVSCIGADAEGNTMNHNADHVAEELATGLGVSTLIFLSDVDGVMHNSALLPHLSAAEGKALIEKGVITGGMIPKVRYAMRAVEKGAPRAVLTNGGRERAVLEALVSNAGTEFVR